jgi:hypothetical protein
MAFFAQKTPKAVEKAMIQFGNIFLAKNISETRPNNTLTEKCKLVDMNQSYLQYAWTSHWAIFKILMMRFRDSQINCSY